MFTWFCKHGICYCFFIIPHAEGRNEAFSCLSKNFVVAPKLVVYDFACALQDYCLNRQPEHFKNTTFLEDRFHWANFPFSVSAFQSPLRPSCSNSVDREDLTPARLLGAAILRLVLVASSQILLLALEASV